MGSSAAEGGGSAVVYDCQPSSGTLTFDTAVASADYRAVSRRLSFAPGEASKTVEVATVADALDEAEETLVLNLTNAQGATITVGSATGRIDDDDDPPAVVATASRAAEGESITFTVSLASVSGRTV